MTNHNIDLASQERFSDAIPSELREAISDPRIRSYKDSDYESLAVWMRDLGRFYDGHDEDNRLLDQLVGAEKGDTKGFFTKNKFMFICEVDGQPTGMICVNYKRGGSAKIGPVIVNPDVRGQGVGSSLMQTAQEVAIAGGVRKLYATTSHLNEHVNHLFTKAGFTTEAELPNQYKKDSIELIWGKHLIEPAHLDTIDVESALKPGETNGDLEITTITSESLQFIAQVNEVYQQWHDDLGSDFIEGMVAGAERGLSFQHKGKVIFVAKDREGEQGMLTFTPKRGGPVKLYPIYGTKEAQRFMIEKAKQIAIQNGNHKFYTFVHISDITQIEFLESIGFKRRGIIESPYKDGHNLVPLDLSIDIEA